MILKGKHWLWRIQKIHKGVYRKNKPPVKSSPFNILYWHCFDTLSCPHTYVQTQKWDYNAYKVICALLLILSAAHFIATKVVFLKPQF